MLKTFLARAALSASDDKMPRTIIHDILDSNLSAKEKIFKRVQDDLATVTVVGFEMTVDVLRLVFYQVFSNAEILSRLRAE